MSCLNYFSKTDSDVYNCDGTSTSGDLPSHTLTSQEKLCMGIDIGVDEWSTYWRTGTCQAMYKSIIKPDGNYSEEGFKCAVEDYNYIFYSYFGPYDPNTNPNGGHHIDETDEMSNLLIDSCSQNQGVCQCVAYNMCSNCKSYEVYEDGLIKKLCGCACQNTVSKVYGIDPYCEPPCASRTTSKHRNFTTGQIDFCRTKVCFVDEPQIFEFDSDCPHCSNNDCECISDKPLTSSLKKRCKKYTNVVEEDEPMYSSYRYYVFLIIIVLFIIVLVVQNSNNIEETIPVLEKIQLRETVSVSTSIPVVKSLEKTQTYDMVDKKRTPLKVSPYYKPKQLYEVNGMEIPQNISLPV